MKLPLLSIALLFAGPSLAAEPTSKYTSTRVGEKPSDELLKAPATTTAELVCPGYGGYQVILCGTDDRSWINLQNGDQVSDLYQAAMQNAPGFFADKANDVVEWRGIEVGGEFVPHAIIYRISGFHEETQSTKTRLLVFRLQDRTAEFLGFAEGKDEDAIAKNIADAPLLKTTN